jgi:hypothetical protein
MRTINRFFATAWLFMTVGILLLSVLSFMPGEDSDPAQLFMGLVLGMLTTVSIYVLAQE